MTSCPNCGYHITELGMCEFKDCKNAATHLIKVEKYHTAYESKLKYCSFHADIFAAIFLATKVR